MLRLVLLWFIRLKFVLGVRLARWEKGVNSRFIFKTINVSMAHICHLIRFCLSLSKNSVNFCFVGFIQGGCECAI
jgi:hypothetical protein